MKTKHHQMELFLNYTIYFAIDETLTIIPGDILKLEIHFMSLIIMMNCGINL